MRGAIDRALERLHWATQSPLHLREDDARFFWSADLLWAFRREGRGLELQADEEIRARLRHRVPTRVEEASRLILAVCARPLPDGDPFSKGPPRSPALSKLDRPVAERALGRLLRLQVVKAPFPPGAEKAVPEEVLRCADRGGWSELTSLDREDPGLADMRGTSSALLALEAAANAGLAVPPERFLTALDLLLRWQAPTGKALRLHLEVVDGDRCHIWSEMAQVRGWGWTGSQADEPLGDTTASGVLGLAICKDMLGKHPGFTEGLRKRTDEGIRDGLAWIQKHFTLRRDPDPRGALSVPAGLLSHYRHLWLHRLVQVGEHLQLRRVGRRDVYGETAEVLLDEQQGDGSWKEPRNRPCAPLLILLRGGAVPTTVVLAPSADGEE